jgi:hypothetical protein
MGTAHTAPGPITVTIITINGQARGIRGVESFISVGGLENSCIRSNVNMGVKSTQPRIFLENPAKPIL